MLSSNVSLHDASKIKFDRFRRPPALRRGICITCKQPAIGFLRLAPFIQLAFVASSHYPDASLLPPPQAHIFYHRRETDIHDELPKHMGYLKSEWAVVTKMTAAITAGLWKHSLE